MKLNAYAKVNLTLDVLNKRDDGYHLIDTVMQSISLCDTITVEQSNKITVICDGVGGCDNIAYNAAKAFFEYTSISGGAEIIIKKNIPFSSGLGGGSADAAAVIHALNNIYSANLSVEDLILIGKKVGADVPFCLVGGTARVGGIGEIVKPVKSLKGFGIVLIKAFEKQSTGKMYSLIDENSLRNKLTDDFMNYINGDNCFRYVGNDFLPLYKGENVINDMNETNPLCASLSGSGPTYFSVYKDIASAQIASEKLNSFGYKTIVADFI